MEITLKIDGKEKTFTQEFVPMKIHRKALEVEKYAKSEDMDEVELLDRRENLLVEIFDKQFTKEQLEDGLNAINHEKVFYNIIGVGVLGYVSIEDKEDMGKFLTELQENVSQSTKK
ncbi:phage tail assembly chaperone G [Metabacillus sp. 22489]|uniref:phage tail assembly chaperone G n=1 Tax=Metabacillus sp. 22489 TaxID=3453928 RepID=UPI003F82D05D